MSATQPVRNKHQVRELAEYYLRRGELRNHLLIVMGVHTALRISDAYCKHKLKKYIINFYELQKAQRPSLLTGAVLLF